MGSAAPLRERLWRIRRRHQVLDAIVRPIEGGSVELEFVLGGHIIHTRVWPTREAAEAAADARLRELQRAGWATHW